MAKQPAASKKDTPGPPVAAPPAPVTAGKFTFALIKDAGPPPPSAALSRANPLPFPAMFAMMGHNDSHFVPDSYWIASRLDGGRGMKKTDNARQKVRESFNAWRKAAEMANSTLVITARKKGDPISDKDPSLLAPEDGLQFWMQLT